MKKIIAAFDGLKYSESTQDYAIYLAKLTGTHLVGIFMDDITYISYKIYQTLVKEGIAENKLERLKAKDKIIRDTAADNFEKNCQQARLEFSVHHDHGIALQELKHESIYADLVIVDAKETLTNYSEKLPTRFIRDLLVDAQCPVLMAPQKFKPIQKILLLYDGGPSSVYAIKMFSYLLPQLKHLPTEVISVNSPYKTLHMPDNTLMKEFMKRHYPKAKYTILKGLAEEEIVKKLKKQEGDALVVLGAYRRGAVSRWFKESMADILIKELKLPLFIAHHK